MAIDWDTERYDAPHNIPGDPAQVAELGKNYRNTADAIKQQAANIRNLVDGNGWDSDSGREFQKKAGDTADKLEKAYARYDAAAAAIGAGVAYPPSGGTWAMSLAHAQDMARAAIRQGQEAQHNSKTMQHQIDQATQANGGKPDTSPGGARMADEKSGYDADMLQAEKDMQAARDFRDAQANKAADAIVNAYKHDGLKDSWWDKFKDAAEDFCVSLGNWAGVVAAIFGVLALVFSWVPVLGEVFGAIAAIASVVALVCDTISALDGRGTWLDVGIDVLGVLSCGAGRVLGEAAKGAKFFEVFNSFKGTQLAKGLRFAKAGEAVGLKGGRASMVAASKGGIAGLPKFGGGRVLAYGKAALSPGKYIEGVQNGLGDIKDLGVLGAVKNGLHASNFPQSMMSGWGATRYVAWGTVPLAMGWSNLAPVKGNQFVNDTYGPNTPDLFGDLKKVAPFGANGVGSTFKSTAG
jgi:hypothetical protein